ncbi:hypothetical protein [Streptomyces sp. 891-h]|uniref:hypothetical protein n=1 Tax=Streptomyces sp. 891-h TaxID=2720714 RepID=UPI001FAB34FD|nr:hypothetical protein [Streptomyces sp. 891-h]UNZ20615.1 hypothetical protein HC362_29665 [Streptomyces sp. 891-h]
MSGCYVAVCSVCGVLYDEDDDLMHLPTVEEAVQYALGYSDGNDLYGWHTEAGLLLCGLDDAVHRVAVRVARETTLPDGQMDLAGRIVHQPDRMRTRRVDCDGRHEEAVEEPCDKPDPLAKSPDAMVGTFAA